MAARLIVLFSRFITHYEWNSEVIGFKDDGQEQYSWVIEFQCGTRPGLPKALCPLGRASDGQCYFTGIQMYVRDIERVEQGRDEMLQYVRSLGPETSKSLAVDWVMTDFSKGTFPHWYKNVTYSEHCGYPCKEGCYNSTTKTWGCCTNNGNFEVVAPMGFE